MRTCITASWCVSICSNISATATTGSNAGRKSILMIHKLPGRKNTLGKSEELSTPLLINGAISRQKPAVLQVPVLKVLATGVVFGPSDSSEQERLGSFYVSSFCFHRIS